MKMSPCLRSGNLADLARISSRFRDSERGHFLNRLDHGYQDGHNIIDLGTHLTQEGKLVEDQYTIAEARNKLPAIIHSVEKGPSVKLTRRGRPMAVLLSIAEYERLNRKMGGLWPALQAVRKHIETEGIEISEADFDDLRDKTPGREVGWTQ